MKALKILQVGRIGDIIIVLPIAEWLHNKGYEIVWPVCSEYYPLFERVPYVKALDLGPHMNNPLTMLSKYHEAQKVGPIDSTLNLSIGFSDQALDNDWLSSGLKFDQWKYQRAQVPFEQKFTLAIKRDPLKEQRLYDELVTTTPYIVTHSTGTRGGITFNSPSIEVTPKTGVSVFDWLLILERAQHIICVDSCIANLINQLSIAVDRRFFIPLGPQYNLIPVLAEGWKSYANNIHDNS